MFDLKKIRENPESFDAGLARRGVSAMSAQVLALDAEARACTAALNDLQTKRNAVSKNIGAAKAKGDDALFEQLRAEVDQIKAEMPEIEAKQKTLQGEVTALLSGLPNIPADDVPDGASEGDNVEVRRWGNPLEIDEAREHFDLGEALGQMDFEAAAKMSGSRFALLRGQLAKLERALANFMLDVHTNEFGYTEVVPPVLVRDNALYGTGQLPKFEEDLFKTTGTHYLIPTAEVALTNIVNDEILAADDLPLRLTAWTPCFRSEAGAAGRDTRGLVRLHQFSKVELVTITTPDQSTDELERMTGCAEEILKRLELPFRTMALCTGDMGFGAQKTYDLEVWLPGQKTYREISSCSNCGDFQGRRMNARFRAPQEKSTQFVHTLNGSGLAVGRAMVAVLENYQQPDGSIAVPAALQAFMGTDKIEKA